MEHRQAQRELHVRIALEDDVAALPAPPPGVALLREQPVETRPLCLLEERPGTLDVRQPPCVDDVGGEAVEHPAVAALVRCDGRSARRTKCAHDAKRAVGLVVHEVAGVLRGARPDRRRLRPGNTRGRRRQPQGRAGPKQAVASGGAHHDGAGSRQRAERDGRQLTPGFLDPLVKQPRAQVHGALDLHPLTVLDLEPSAVGKRQQLAVGPFPVEDAWSPDPRRCGGMFDDRGAGHANPAVPELERSRISGLALGVDPRDVEAPARFACRLWNRFFPHR